MFTHLYPSAYSSRVSLYIRDYSFLLSSLPLLLLLLPLFTHLCFSLFLSLKLSISASFPAMASSLDCLIFGNFFFFFFIFISKIFGFLLCFSYRLGRHSVSLQNWNCCCLQEKHRRSQSHTSLLCFFHLLHGFSPYLTFPPLVTDFLIQKCGFPETQAPILRTELFKTYGSTLAGLRVISSSKTPNLHYKIHEHQL